MFARTLRAQAAACVPPMLGLQDNAHNSTILELMNFLNACVDCISNMVNRAYLQQALLVRIACIEISESKALQDRSVRGQSPRTHR